MPRRHYHLAQVNIGRMLAPLDSEIMAGFVNNLDRINALQKAAPAMCGGSKVMVMTRPACAPTRTT